MRRTERGELVAENLNENGVHTTVDGVRAIELRYRAVRETDTENIAFYQSSMRLNSPSLGVLTPERFVPALEADDRCVTIFQLALVQMLQALEKFHERELKFDWVSVFMPLRLLARPDCVDIVRQTAEKCNVPPYRICLEFPLSLLERNDTVCAVSISKLKKLGFHTMLTDVGGNGCPLLKLADYELDYIMLDSELVGMLGSGERSEACVKSVISLINDLGAEPIASGVLSPEQANKLFQFECSYYSGAYAGNYMLERFVRKGQS